MTLARRVEKVAAGVQRMELAALTRAEFPEMTPAEVEDLVAEVWPWALLARRCDPVGAARDMLAEAMAMPIDQLLAEMGYEWVPDEAEAAEPACAR